MLKLKPSHAYFSLRTVVSIPFDYVLSLFYLLSLFFFCFQFYFLHVLLSLILVTLLQFIALTEDSSVLTTQFHVRVAIFNAFEFNGVISLKTPKTKQ